MILKHGILSIVPWASLVLLLSGCSKTQTDYYPNGSVMSVRHYSGKKLQGEAVWFYQNGVKQQEVTFRRDKPEGLMTRWYVNGNKQREDHYAGGLKNGLSASWDENGNKTEEETYRNDTLDGAYTYWYPTGIVKISGSFSGGLYDGKWEYFSETGIKVGEGNYSKGRGVLKGFNHDGTLSRIVNYENNLKQGEEIVYNRDGSVSQTIVYDKGKVVSTREGR